MDSQDKLSKQATVALLGFGVIIWILGMASMLAFQYTFGPEEISQDQHEQIIQDIAKERQELTRLRKLTYELSDTITKYKYSAEIEFSTLVIDADQLIYDLDQKSILSIQVPISKSFYHSSRDSMMIKGLTKQINENSINIIKAKLVKRNKYAIN